MNTIRQITKTMIPLIAILSVISVAQAGTGAGNGGKTERDKYLKELREELGKLELKNRDKGDEELTNWAAKISKVLKRELRKADLHIAANDIDQAEIVMIDAMRIAAESLECDPDLSLPLTKTFLDRGLMLSQALDDAMPASNRKDGDRHQKMTKVNILREYIAFVNDMTDELDRPYYIPYQYKYGGDAEKCKDDKDENFIKNLESTYVYYTKRFMGFGISDSVVELEVVKERKKWDDDCYENDKKEVVRILPVGSSKGFLTVAEMVAGMSADDLLGNLYRNRYLDVIEDLDQLNEDLEDYNVHKIKTFPNLKWAISETYERLKKAYDDLVVPEGAGKERDLGGREGRFRK